MVPTTYMGNRMTSRKNRKCISADLHRKGAAFSPILPFPTPSDLSALYTLGPELGRGQFGIIRSCTSRSSGTFFACKSISKHTCDVEDVVGEVCIMKHLSGAVKMQTNCISPRSHIPGSGIVCLQDVIEDEEFVHLIMELCRGGELYGRIRKKKCYPEAQAAFLIKSLVEAVKFCHSMGIIHRDIKPENILLIEDSESSPIKLTDFGLALEFTPGKKFRGMAGSSYYIAPEVLQGDYSEEIDMWSAGVILFILLSGVPPFSGATQQRTFNAIQKGGLSFSSSTWDYISASAKDLIMQMLHPDAKSRLTPVQALKHPWILYHTKNVTSGIWPFLATFAGSAGNLSSHRLSLSTARSSTLARAGTLTYAAAKLELNKILVDLIAGMNRSTFSVSEALAAKGLQNGWTCIVSSLTENEETVVIEMGQEKYMVSHDRIRKRIGWSLVKDKSVPAKQTVHRFQNP